MRRQGRLKVSPGMDLDGGGHFQVSSSGQSREAERRDDPTETTIYMLFHNNIYRQN
jgi:hypothetical protein